MTDEIYSKKLADMQTQIKELVPDSLKENGERRMKEWICREMSTSTSPNENGILMIEKELIRCEDCKHCDGYFCHNKWWGNGYGNYAPPIKKKEGFCDWAERKEE